MSTGFITTSQQFLRRRFVVHKKLPEVQGHFSRLTIYQKCHINDTTQHYRKSRISC